MRSGICLAGLTVLLLAANTQAGGVARVRADVPSRVTLDGELMGTTPLTVSDIAPGKHEIRVEDPVTGAVRTFAFHSPRQATVERELVAEFGTAGTVLVPQNPPPVAAPARTVYSYETYQPAPVVYQPSVVVRPVYYPVYRPEPYFRIGYGWSGSRGHHGYGHHGYGHHGYGHHGSRSGFSFSFGSRRGGCW